MSIKAIGIAPNDSVCDCESVACHPRMRCKSEAYFLVEAFGHRQRLCAPCFKKARLASGGDK